MSECSYGTVNRTMINNLLEDFKDFRMEIRKEFSELKTTNSTLYNHLSNRLPPWATAIGATAIAFVSGFIGIMVGIR